METLRWRQQCAERFYAPLRDDDDRFRRVGWESQLAHQLRLRTLLSAVGPLAPVRTLLDVGCGEGELLPLLQRAGFAGQYHGEDILPAMIERARERFPEAAFTHCDSLEGGPMADAVFCSGSLNTAVDSDDHTQYVIDAIGALWERTRAVLVVDFAVSDRHPPGALIGRCEIDRLWSAARGLCAAATVSESAIPGEGYLVLRRNHRLALSALLQPGDDPVQLAEILLHGGEAAAAQVVIESCAGDEAEMLTCVADFQLGRVRRAETGLRRLAAGSALRGRAQLNLAVLCDLTHRRREALQLLEALVNDVGCAEVDRDAGRLLLARYLLTDGDIPGATAVLEAISSAWIRREGDALLRAQQPGLE